MTNFTDTEKILKQLDILLRNNIQNVAKRSITAEDYLKAIDEYTHYNGFATLSDLAHLLNTKRQSAYDEIKILIENGLVVRVSKGRYLLTEKGRQEANIFLRKHRIAEILLWKGLSIAWEIVDEEAMGIEHGITEAIAEAVCLKYGCEFCPHGNPVPDRDGMVTEPVDLYYSNLQKGRKYRVSRVIFENQDILDFLGNNRIFPGKIVTVGPDGALIVNTDRGDVQIPRNAARALTYLKYEP